MYLLALSPSLITVSPEVGTCEWFVPYKAVRYHNPEGTSQNIHSYGNMEASDKYRVLTFYSVNGLGLPGK